MVQLFLLCIATGLLSCFIDKCFEEGMIFSRYYQFMLNSSLPDWIFKPLGGCVYCFGTWVCIVFMALFHVKLLYFPLGIGINYFAILATLKINDL
jgi:hypothetical protein